MKFLSPDLDKFISSSCAAIVRQTALDLKNKGGFTFGSWLQALPPVDLDHLNRLYDEAITKRNEVTDGGEVLMELTMLLSIAEGLDLADADLNDTMRKRFAAMGLQLSMERMDRLGVITFTRSAATLGLEPGDTTTIAKIRDM